MLESQAQQTSEAQLAILLGELLDDGARDTGGSVAGEVAPEVVELRDMARLLRASSLSVPLPEGRHAVRRALLATAEKNYFEGIPARAAWRRTGRWLGMAAMMVLIVGAFGLGAGLLDSFGSPSSPLYGLRLAVDRVRTALVPGLTPGTGSPAARARTAEIQEMATSGYAPAAVTGYPLTYRFPAHTLPSVPGEMATLEGSIGGLPATLVLRTSAGCPQGQSCGVFMAWVTPLEGTRASAEFGQMSGTFACAAGECKLTLVSKTGVFGKLTASVLTVNGKTAATGLLGTAFTSLGDWVATVEQAAAALKAEGVLPAGVSVADLVSDAASNQRDRDPKRSPQGTSGGSSSSDANAGSSGSASVGPIIVSHGSTRGSTDAGGGLSASGGISVTGSGVSVGGTISGSGSTSGGSASGAVSGSTSPNSGSASGSTSASGTASGSISIDSGAIGVASAIGATLGSTSTSGRVNGSGNANGGGVNVGGSVGVSGAPSSGGGLGGLGGGLGGLGGGLGGILH